MNDRQRSKYNSQLAVCTLCEQDANRTLSCSLPVWAAIYDRFLAKISHADACVLTRASNIAGITTAKKSARTSLIASIIETGGALCTLALLREDPVLEPKADIVPSSLANMPDHLVDDKATEFLNLARAIPAPAPGSSEHGLASVGLTEGRLDLLETRTETYNLLLGSPRTARGQKTAATANLQQILDDIDRFLEKGLDKLAVQFSGTSFHQEYTLARSAIFSSPRKLKAIARKPGP